MPNPENPENPEISEFRQQFRATLSLQGRLNFLCIKLDCLETELKRLESLETEIKRPTLWDHLLDDTE